ncbi:MAG: hypothetical protein JEZ09_02165 [Salinivirgaceae bacterium]|nr:hypothetical protein [Salinivirgaceae bacterium]
MKVFCASILMFFGLLFNSFANETAVQKESKKVSVFVNVDFMSSHVWRGGKSGELPSFEPLIEASFGNITVGSWAAATFDGKYKELDLYVNYNINDFTVALFDYYCPPENLHEAKFTNLNKENTFHLYSIDLSYEGSEKIPVKFTASTMLYGMDYNSETGEYYYSTYLEAQYNKGWKSNTVSVVLGMTTHEGIYAKKTAIMNTELMYKRTFELKSFTIPVFAKVVYNPYSNKSYFIGGLSISREFKI